MYSVIIADDSKKICEGLQEIIPAERPELEITGVYYNGRSLLEALALKLPDIIISDIRMPGADGLEVCEYLRSRNADTKIILITAFQEFEYAKKAIDYRVSAFLIKPYSSAQLFEALDNAVASFEEKQSYANALTDLYLTRREEIKQKISAIYSKKAPCENIKTALMMNQAVVAEECLILEADILQENTLELYKEDFDFESPFLSCFTVDKGHIILFFKDKAYADSLFTDFIKEANFAGREIKLKSTKVMSFDEWSLFCFIRNLSLELADALRQMNIKQFTDSLSSQAPISENILLCVLKEACRILKSDIDFGKFNINKDETNEETLLRFTAFYLNSDNTQSIAQKIKHYIMLNFSDSSLSVSKIAEHLSLNSDYISNNFKRETGKTITEFVTNTRIAEAMKLLENKELSINSIAASVGFNDISYFNRVFKKLNSVTPTQYQRRRDKK